MFTSETLRLFIANKDKLQPTGQNLSRVFGAVFIDRSKFDRRSFDRLPIDRPVVIFYQLTDQPLDRRVMLIFHLTDQIFDQLIH
jgi:hypothetical protein